MMKYRYITETHFVQKYAGGEFAGDFVAPRALSELPYACGRTIPYPTTYWEVETSHGWRGAILDHVGNPAFFWHNNEWHNFTTLAKKEGFIQCLPEYPKSPTGPFSYEEEFGQRFTSEGEPFFIERHNQTAT